ncbi:MAG: hypothetical protein BroJett033_4010 [Chloroflexota bacterium]|nr:MAG: hypothetical protein BroJett033_4010 [Chloroflexota bacterium]
MADSGDDTHDRVDLYRQIVLQYEQINAEIAALFARGGGSENMTHEDRVRYKKLARRRDELQNDMRVLEQQLLDDDSYT